MDKTKKESFLSKVLSVRKKVENKRLYENTNKTTTKIKLALLDLLTSKQLAQISITNLVKVAGIYRATFYLHYKSLEDVIVDIERDIYECYNTIKAKLDNVDIYNNLSILIEMIGEYIQLDRKYLQVIINTKCFNRLTLMLKELLDNIVIDNFSNFGHMCNNERFKLSISMFTGGLVFAYRDWVNSADMKFSVLENYIKNIGNYFFKNIDN